MLGMEIPAHTDSNDKTIRTIYFTLNNVCPSFMKLRPFDTRKMPVFTMVFTETTTIGSKDKRFNPKITTIKLISNVV